MEICHCLVGFCGIRPSFLHDGVRKAENPYFCRINQIMLRIEEIYEFHYILKDHLGSWTVIADEYGKVFFG